jgi:hypothetical protein
MPSSDNLVCFTVQQEAHANHHFHIQPCHWSAPTKAQSHYNRLCIIWPHAAKQRLAVEVKQRTFCILVDELLKLEDTDAEETLLRLVADSVAGKRLNENESKISSTAT